jgi:hypothetical protein
MSVTVEQSGESDTDEQIRQLVARGFRFIDPRDDNGEVVALVAVRAHDDVIDIVHLRAEDDVVASRMPSTENVWAPTKVFWQQTGSASEVLGKLLALSDDRTSHLVIATSSDVLGLGPSRHPAHSA